MTIKSILRRSFINPFSVILISLAAISFVADVLFASNFSKNFSTFIILLTMFFVSAVIRLVQELKSKRTVDYLASLVETDVIVWTSDEQSPGKCGKWGQTSSSNLKAGDKILLRRCIQGSVPSGIDESNIMAFIRKLRKKVETNPDSPEYILTVWGIGYKFVE